MFWQDLARSDFRWKGWHETDFNIFQHTLVGGFNRLKNISQLGLFFPIYGKIWKIQNVPNHQPV
jgi:hypothetical protein